MAKIEFTIKNGEVFIEIFGVEDASCEDITKVFQEELGAVVEHHEKQQEWVELDQISISES